MIQRIKSAHPGRMIILSGLFIFLLFSQVINGQESRQLTQNELNAELRTALEQNDEARTIELIKNHRLFIKPFVDALVQESIRMELKGKLEESEKLNRMASKAAETFNRIFYEKSLVIGVNYLTMWSKEQKRMKLMADSLYSAGLGLRDNEPEKAIECYKNALNTFRKIPDERGEAEVLGGLGQVYWDKDNQASLSYYGEALEKRIKVDDKQLIGNTLNSIGLYYSTFLNDYDRAIEYFDKAVLIRTEIGDQVSINRTLSFKAEAYLKAGDYFNSIGDYPEAIANMENALQMHRNLNNRIRTGVILSQMGYVYANMGDLSTALEKLNEAAVIMKEEHDTLELAGVYNHLGIVLQSAGRIDRSLEYYNNAISLYEKQKAFMEELAILSNIGTTFFDLKDYAKAEEYHLRALRISRELEAKDEEARCLLNLANDQNLLKKLDDAKSNYDKGLEIAFSLNNPDLIWRFVVGTAEYYEQKGNINKAVELNDSALKILEGIRNTLQTEEWKTSFMAQERYVFEDLIDLLCKLHNTDQTRGYDTLAFQYAERSKSRSFLDQLAESAVNVNIVAGQRSDTLRYSKIISFNEAKALCSDKNTIILAYSVGDSSSSLWAITRTNHQLYRLPNRKTFQELIETIRFSLLNPQKSISEFFTQAGITLYNELIKPAEPFLSKKSRLVIIPDGVLNYLPFEVLLTENKKLVAEASFADMPFLVKKYPVSYVQSASVLKTLISEKEKGKESGVKSKKLLAFGDPVYEDTLNKSWAKYPRLEFSGREIENIASFFRGGSPEIYLRNNATEENLKRNSELDKFNYIHYAVHGLINEDKPDLSSLVLTTSRNSGEDGFLQATEIFKLKLNPELVVLSACQTGLGKLVRGEGMVGLTRAFMYAGTPSVLVSLWSVSDVSTAALMGEFYKNLIKNKLSKTDALREAQLTLISDQKYSNPFYWAPFILVGDWR
jgi:CHAT domain-containing protein/Tfp pilus assembly protein PilF/uncharacterized protein YaaR (DUF327 family)